MIAYRDQILEGLLNYETVALYCFWHDIGKPFCRTIDETGKVHFPNHAKKSAEIYLEMTKDSFYKEQNQQIARLIEMDMDIHILKAVDLDAFCERPEAISLLVVAFCEIHANAEMFGGIESDSFKIKWKHLDRRGKAICKKLFP